VPENGAALSLHCRLSSGLRAVLIALLLSIVPPAHAAATQMKPVAVTLGHSMVTLDGPWMFQVGDNPRWAQPGFDDSGWEHVDFAAPPGATDGDVGIENYAPGWTAKGHPRYHGFAWYRIRLNATPPEGESLALLGPWAVDSAYQVYANGALLGGVGGFSGATPTAYGYQYPRMFVLPPQAASGPLVIAIRVWMGPWGAPQAGSGGIHVAPAIGVRNAVTAQYRLQWLKIFEGYALDAVLGLLFFLSAALVLCLIPFDPGSRTYLWLAIALILSGIQRGNQAFFFWWQIETIQDFVIFIAALTGSFALGAWLMAWRSWFRLDRPVWLPWAIAVLTFSLVVAQLLLRPWVFDAEFPRAVLVGLRNLIAGIRLAFLLLLALIVLLGLRREGREGWFALPAVLAAVTVLFPGELVGIGLPGIWFPWGIGVSLSECASAALVVLLCILIVRRLWSHAPRRAAAPSLS
jgi:hypothetical protein